jgi:hypothetical protein
MQLALDTNLLVYAEGVVVHSDDAPKAERIRALLPALPPDEVANPLAAVRHPLLEALLASGR